jgi:hypothetical protein
LKSREPRAHDYNVETFHNLSSAPPSTSMKAALFETSRQFSVLSFQFSVFSEGKLLSEN